jgi:hypothetical protein
MWEEEVVILFQAPTRNFWEAIEKNHEKPQERRRPNRNSNREPSLLKPEASAFEPTCSVAWPCFENCVRNFSRYGDCLAKQKEEYLLTLYSVISAVELVTTSSSSSFLLLPYKIWILYFPYRSKALIEHICICNK